jgi:nucleoside-triphosphatase THEP1
MYKNIHDIWLKAAVIGGLWGASEIVLGSFLHNLRIPEIAGNILTAIGIILLIASHHIWRERGILWRAGLICAALKLLSPSPVIFGPIIAITMQAFLVYGSISIFGSNMVGYLVGGGCAMMWNLVLRILYALVVFGTALIELYQSIVDTFFEYFHLPVSGYWIPLIAAFLVFFIFGCAASIVGIYIGRKSVQYRNTIQIHANRSIEHFPIASASKSNSNYSSVKIFLHLLSLGAGLYLVYNYPFTLGLSALFLYAGVIFFTERSILWPVIYKPFFWIGLIILTVLTGIFLGENNNSTPVSAEGFQIGVEMSMRALFIVIGFNAMSRELGNPRLLQSASRLGLHRFTNIMQVVFNVVPHMIAELPKGTQWRNPVRVLSGMINKLEDWLSVIHQQQNRVNMIFILSGKQNSGKSTILYQVITGLQERGFQIAGIQAPAIMRNGRKIGFSVQNVRTGEKALLCKRRTESISSLPQSFDFYEDGLNLGRDALSPKAINDADIIIIDEVGPIELKGECWAEAIEQFLSTSEKPMLWVVRKGLVDKVCMHFGVMNRYVFDVEFHNTESIVSEIIKYIK